MDPHLTARLLERAAKLREAEPHGSFSDLCKNCLPTNRDFTISAVSRSNSQIVVATPHGGTIEPGTDVLVNLIAERFQFSSYAFICNTPIQHQRYHITSAKFDDPKLLTMLSESKTAMGIHTSPGYLGTFVGGGAPESAKESLIKALRQSGFRANKDLIYPGVATKNFCNRAQNPGFQLEIHQDWLDNLMDTDNAAHLSRFVDCLGNFLLKYSKELS